MAHTNFSWNTNVQKLLKARHCYCSLSYRFYWKYLGGKTHTKFLFASAKLPSPDCPPLENNQVGHKHMKQTAACLCFPYNDLLWLPITTVASDEKVQVLSEAVIESQVRESLSWSTATNKTETGTLTPYSQFTGSKTSSRGAVQYVLDKCRIRNKCWPGFRPSSFRSTKSDQAQLSINLGIVIENSQQASRCVDDASYIYAWQYTSFHSLVDTAETSCSCACIADINATSLRSSISTCSSQAPPLVEKKAPNL